MNDFWISFLKSFFLEKEESGESGETGGSGGSTLELSFNLGGSVGFGKYALKDP